jgi:hypothetical protein
MEPLRIRIKKGRDGPNSLVCIRADGSHTMQHHPTDFFPVHDLTHYAVETTLGYRRGFFGLVAEGWDLSDFGAPWPRGPIPADADPAELIVGFLDMERHTGTRLSTPEFNATMAAWYAQHGLPAPEDTLSEEQLANIRARISELVGRWEALAPGETLELLFAPAG